MTLKLDDFRRRLEGERARLSEELEQMRKESPSSERSRPRSGYGNHMADDATETFEQEKNLALAASLRAFLSQVEHALGKMREGTYGLCDDCGQAINPDRLDALPHAHLCITCKSLQEKNAKIKRGWK